MLPRFRDTVFVTLSAALVARTLVPVCPFAVPAAHIMCPLCVEYLVCCSVEPVDEMQTHTHHLARSLMPIAYPCVKIKK